MNNGDLISREALTKRMTFYKSEFEPGEDFDSAVLMINNAPTADAVELPCKIGDTVWCIRNFHGHKHAQEGIVSEMNFTKAMKLQIVVKYVGRGQWGEKIFPTQEEAEAAINKKEKNHEDN